MKTPSRTLLLIAGGLAVLLGLLAIYGERRGVGNGDQPVAAATGPLAGLNTGEMAAFVPKDPPAEIAAITFQDADGKDRTLADWKGKVVLLNVWATWCAPCRKEMPALLALKQKLGGAKFDVVAVSTDRGGIEKPRKFLTEAGALELGLFIDGGGRLASTLGVIGMPTTLLIDANGKEIGRLLGPAEWGSEDAQKLIDAALKARA